MLSDIAIGNATRVNSDEPYSCSYDNAKIVGACDDINDDDHDSTCSSNDTNECIEFFLGLKKNKFALDDMKDVQYDDDCNNDLECLESSKRHDSVIEEVLGDCQRKFLMVKKDNIPLMEMNLENSGDDGGDEYYNDVKQWKPTKWNIDEDVNHQKQFLCWFKYAYLTPATTCNISKSLGLQQQQHRVRIVYNQLHQYFSLVASAEGTQQGVIPKGTILYTERPLFATQIPSSSPSSSYKNHVRTRRNQASSFAAQQSGGITESTTLDDNFTQCNDHYEHYKVRACQCCFRSLEPISSCYSCCSNTRNNRTPNQEVDPLLVLPLQYLYPVPDFHFIHETPETNDENDGKEEPKLHHRKDQYGRIQCTACHSYFCSQQCYHQMIQQYGSCCSCIQHLQNATQPSKQVSPTANVLLLHYSAANHIPDINNNSNNNNNKNVNENENCGNSNVNDADDPHEKCDDNDPLWESMQQPAIALAVRMFVATLHQYRSTNVQISKNTAVVDGLCGTDTDVQLLEIGIPIRMNANNIMNSEGIESTTQASVTVRYTVEPIFDMLIHVHSVTKLEQAKLFTLEYFMSLCSKAARNGFGIRPQSPFQSYYAGIVRSSIYRGSTQHVKLQNQVANALLGCASSDAQFQRGMDRMIDERVCPEVVALYPLTSRINHSCVPNSEVRSQQYIDATIDVVAIRDIKIGDEITISYIYGTGSSTASNISSNISNSTTQRQRNQKSTHRRQQELYAKYLFHCDCFLCQEQATSTATT